MPPHLSVDEALERVLASTPPGRAEPVALDLAVGRVLAGDVTADRDYPAFPRSRVDGYALRAADAALGELPVAMEIAAGAALPPALPPGAAARIFTGAAAPPGADTVVMQEHCTTPAPGRVRLERPVEAAQNLVPVGFERAAGESVARRGEVVTPALVAALASVGAVRPRCAAAPRVRVVATGDEIVPVDADPPPGRIRNSNAPALLAAARGFGALPDGAFHAADTPGALDAVLGAALDADVCLLTGGVSVGDYDLVPAELERAGVRQVLHGVRLQPGKPLWFGVRGTTLVFGLPGNPVSTLVTAALFVRPAIRRLLGVDPAAPGPRRAVLTDALRPGTWRRRYDPVRLVFEGERVLARPVRYRGSGDVFGFAAADALAVVPEESPALAAGAEVDVVPLPAWNA